MIYLTTQICRPFIYQQALQTKLKFRKLSPNNIILKISFAKYNIKTICHSHFLNGQKDTPCNSEDEREIAKKIKKLISLEIHIMQIEILRHHLLPIKLAWIFYFFIF